MTLAVTKVASRFTIHVEQIDGFEFRVKFDKEQFAPLELDEPPPLGHDRGPSASRVLAAAIGNCLAASLVFCLQKAKVPVSGVVADVDVETVRNEARRLRVGKVTVTLRTNLPANEPSLAGCLADFEDYCVVTQSVRRGIEVEVHVQDAAGTPVR